MVVLHRIKLTVGCESLARKSGIELDIYGFGKNNPLSPTETCPGIFISGPSRSVISLIRMTASGAVPGVASCLTTVGGLTRKSISSGEGCFRRGTQNRSLCMPLRCQYRQRVDVPRQEYA